MTRRTIPGSSDALAGRDPGSSAEAEESSRTISRRAFLGACASTGAAVLAGCAHANYTSMRFERVERTELAQLGREAAVTDPDGPAVIEELARNGTASVAAADPPVQNGSVVLGGDGAAYEVRILETEVRGTAHTFGFERLSDPPDEAALEADELPSADRSVLETAFPASDEPLSFGAEGTVDAKATSVRNESVKSRSELQDADGDSLAYDGERYRVRVRDDGEGVHFEYGATERAPDAASYGRQVTRRRAVDLDDLSGTEREIAAEAADGRVLKEDVDDAAFESVASRLESAEPIDDDAPVDRWFVEFEETIYRGEVSRA